MPSDIDKRTIAFSTIGELDGDLHTLLSQGYDAKGNWNLAQTCIHVNEWMRYPMDGFPVPPLPIRAMLWLMSKTIGPGMKRKIMSEGFSAGMMTDPKTVPDASVMSEVEAARTLQDTVVRLSQFNQPLHASPIFGPMDRDTALKVGLMHAAHHLAFLHPRV